MVDVVYDTASCLQQQESPRPLTALKIRPSPTLLSPVVDGAATPTSPTIKIILKNQGTRPSSNRLSTELDQLLQWEGLTKPSFSGHASRLSNEILVDASNINCDPAVTIHGLHDQDDLDLDLDNGESLTELNEMLASARKKLDMLEDNLRGARDSLFVPPMLPSPASTGSLRSTISSTLSHTFSNLSEEYNQPEYPARTNFLLSTAPIVECGTEHHRISEYDPYSYEKGLPSTALAPASVSQESCSTTIQPKPAVQATENLPSITAAPLHDSKIQEKTLSHTKPQIDHVHAYQTHLDSMSNIRQPIPTTSPQSIDLRRLSLVSNTTTRLLAPSKSLPTLRTGPDTDLPDKHTSISTFTSSATETESYSSGWDSESDDSDTEELLHDEFEGTWPMPPASSGTKPKFACTRITPSPRQPGGMFKDTEPTALPPVHVAGDKVRSTLGAAVSNSNPGSNSDNTPPHNPTLRAQTSRDLSTPTPTPRKPASQAPPPQVQHNTTNTARAQPSSTIYSSPRTESKALTASDQVLAFAFAEKMHEACLWLRDGKEDEKRMWRERVERAQRALRGEL